MAVGGSSWENAWHLLGHRSAAQAAVLLTVARGLVVLVWLGLVFVGLILVGGVVLGMINTLI